MQSPSRTARTLLTFSLLTLVLAAQGPKAPEGILWQPSWKTALATAQAEGKPVMIAFILKGETANDEVLRNHFKDAGLIDETRNFVCLLAGKNFVGEAEGVRFDGATGPINPDAGSVSSAEIAGVEDYVRRRVLEASTVSCPQFLFYDPKAENLLLRHVWMLPKAELVRKMKLARSFLDPKNIPEEFKTAHGQVTDLLQKATDRETSVRRAALEELAKRDDARIPKFLVDRTQDKVVSEQRHEAIFTMGTKANAKVLERLHQLLRAKDVETRVHAAVSISKVALVDSTLALTTALKKERQDRVRSHLLRALANCEPDMDLLRKGLLDSMRSRSDLEVITCLWLSRGLAEHPDLIKIIGKLFAHRDDDVRMAAFFAAGSLGLLDLKKTVASRVPREKGKVKDAALWAYSMLGGEVYEGETDVEAEVYAMLPDNHLHEGRFEGGGGDGRGGRGGRGGGGGRGGRGGGGRIR